MPAKLVSLNIPSGWAVIHNSFGDEDPYIHNGWIANHESYNENLLSIQPIQSHENRWEMSPEGYQVELGWYPSCNPHGCYCLKLLKGPEKQEVYEYKSQKRQVIRQVIEQYFRLILQGLEPEQIQQELSGSKRKFEKGHRQFAGIRKSLEDEAIDKKNRSTYSQVGYESVYYELTNLAYLEGKPNKMPYNTFVAENQKT